MSVGWEAISDYCHGLISVLDMCEPLVDSQQIGINEVAGFSESVLSPRMKSLRKVIADAGRSRACHEVKNILGREHAR